MEKSENRLVEIFDELRSLGYFTTQKEFAQMLGVHHTTLSSAINGREGAINPKIVATAERLRRQLLNNEDPAPTPAPAPPRNVEELSPAEMLRIIGGQADTIRSQQEVIARLLGADTKKGAV